MKRAEFLEIVNQYLSISDLKSICFQLEIDYEDLAADGKLGKAIELYLYLERRKRLDEFIEICRINRPDIPFVSSGAPKQADATLSLFISYSHRDRQWLDILKTSIQPLIQSQEKLELWDDTKIDLGKSWKAEIDAALSRCKLAILLVSPHFLASDFIMQEELPYILNATKQGDIKLAWILVSSCLYEASDLVHFQAAHDIQRPLDSLNPAELNSTLTSIARKIKNALDI